VPPECEVGLDPLLERGEPCVLEPRSGVSCEGLGLELGERRAAPELERLGKALCRGLRVAGAQELAPLSGEALEAIEVELALFDAQRVARRLRQQPICPERFSQLRDVALEGFRRVSGGSSPRGPRSAGRQKQPGYCSVKAPPEAHGAWLQAMKWAVRRQRLQPVRGREIRATKR
jgi:hypothetical protein